MKSSTHTVESSETHQSREGNESPTSPLKLIPGALESSVVKSSPLVKATVVEISSVSINAMCKQVTSVSHHFYLQGRCLIKFPALTSNWIAGVLIIITGVWSALCDI